jgi:hypothetical protein
LSILVTRLDEHAQPPWRISAKATLCERSPYVPLTLTLSQRARGLGEFARRHNTCPIAPDSGAAMPRILPAVLL